MSVKNKWTPVVIIVVGLTFGIGIVLFAQTGSEKATAAPSLADATLTADSTREEIAAVLGGVDLRYRSIHAVQRTVTHQGYTHETETWLSYDIPGMRVEESGYEPNADSPSLTSLEIDDGVYKLVQNGTEAPDIYNSTLSTPQGREIIPPETPDIDAIVSERLAADWVPTSWHSGRTASYISPLGIMAQFADPDRLTIIEQYITDLNGREALYIDTRLNEYPVEYWIDVETGIVLKQSVYDLDGSFNESSEIVSFELDPSFDASLFAIDHSLYDPHAFDDIIMTPPAP